MYSICIISSYGYLGIVSIGFTGKCMKGVWGTLDLNLLLQMKWSMAGVTEVLTWEAEQAGVCCLHQGNATGHWLHPHLTPCWEIHWPVDSEQGWRQSTRLWFFYYIFKNGFCMLFSVFCVMSTVLYWFISVSRKVPAANQQLPLLGLLLIPIGQLLYNHKCVCVTGSY